MGGQGGKTPLKKTLEEITIAIQTQLGMLDATGKEGKRTQRGRKRQPQIDAGSSLRGNAMEHPAAVRHTQTHDFTETWDWGPGLPQGYEQALRP